jgi:SAM-dependent methyltransferase
MAEVAPASESPTTPATHDSRTLWDSVGAKYEKAFEGLPSQLRSLEWITSQLFSAGIKPAKCLDIGCGTGRPVCQHLVEAGHEVLGIDISPEMIKTAEGHVPVAKFEVADIKSWTPPNGEASYDLITAYFSLIANLTQDEIRSTIQRIHSWLKLGGIFVFATVPVPANNAEIKWMGRDVIVSGLSVEEFGQWFKEVGFEVVNKEESSFLPKGFEAGLVASREEVWEEGHLFIYARKK